MNSDKDIENLAREVVLAIIRTNSDFKDWWNSIDEIDKREISEELQDIIYEWSMRRK